jgi:hypothetical protein
MRLLNSYRISGLEPFGGKYGQAANESFDPLLEAVCAENNLQFDYHMPVADKPDL